MKPASNLVYSVDKKGPRMRKAKFSTRIVSKELFKSFKASFPEYKDMEWKDFYECWKEISEMIRTEIVTNPLGVKLGGFVGEIKYQYLPFKTRGVDQKSSQELGEKVIFSNILTKGKVGVLRWERRSATRFNKILRVYKFKETRELNILAKQYTDNNPEKIRVAKVSEKDMYNEQNRNK